MVTIAEVAERLKIPASTSREYVKRFKPFFPTKKVAGARFPKYPDIALEVMQDIVEGYKKQQSTDDIFDLLQQKYPLDAELLDRQQQQSQNIPNSNNDAMITAPTTSQTSLDMYVKMQASQFQVLQQMTQVLENNNKLMERLIGLLEKQQTPPTKPAIKLMRLKIRRKAARPKQKRTQPQHKQAEKSSKQLKKAKPEKPKKKGFFSFFTGK
jgi:hypothetical protein